MEIEAWERLINGTNCPMCSNKFPKNLLLSLPSGRTLLLDDGDFKGYLILEYRRHVTEITDLSAQERAQLAEDVNTCASVLQSVLHPDKINYVILGNEVPHLHVHVIPRYFDDGWWGKPTWLRPPDRKRTLPMELYEKLRETLLNAFEEAGKK
jgi:diadenosine tetraphosphate (Ap4A) HIT family hydrolase